MLSTQRRCHGVSTAWAPVRTTDPADGVSRLDTRPDRHHRKSAPRSSRSAAARDLASMIERQVVRLPQRVERVLVVRRCPEVAPSDPTRAAAGVTPMCVEAATGRTISGKGAGGWPPGPETRSRRSRIEAAGVARVAPAGSARDRGASGCGSCDHDTRDCALIRRAAGPAAASRRLDRGRATRCRRPQAVDGRLECRLLNVGEHDTSTGPTERSSGGQPDATAPPVTTAPALRTSSVRSPRGPG